MIEEGKDLVIQIQNLQRRMSEFTNRYITAISEKKKESKFLGFFGNKAPKHTQDDLK